MAEINNDIVTYIIIGFSNYIIENKQLFRISYKTKSKSCKWQYREKRKIKITEKDGCIGYFLVKNNTSKFYPLSKLKHKLKKLP